jgi:hypothetical protein
MEHTQAGATHQPQMQSGDVGVADERLGVSPKDFRIEMRKHAHRSVSTRSPDDGLHTRVEPHPHEVFGASLVFTSLKASQFADLGVEEHGEPRALERFHAAHEPAFAR